MMSEMARAYLQESLNNTLDEDDMPLALLYVVDDFSPATVAQAEQDLASFVGQAGAEASSVPDDVIGTGFWLVRNWCRAGYWYEYSPLLVDVARRFGTVRVQTPLNEQDSLSLT